MDQHHFLHHHHYHHPQEHRTARYTSLPSQSHHHNNLPPPPPAPPPPLSYHRTLPTPQPQHQQHPFPSHHHRPLEEDHSLPPYDLLPRRIPWSSPNPNPNPNTNPREEFDRDFHHHHHRPSPIEPLRYDTNRLVPVDPYEQNPAEHFPWPGGTFYAPSQADVDTKPYVRVYSVDRDDAADVANRNSRVESKRWVMSDRERGRELHESASSNLVNGSCNISEKYYHGSDLGNRYNNRGNNVREFGHGHGHGHHGHEFARTPPKKQVQKKSALLRIQTVKPNHRNREIEQLRYPGYGNEFLRGKEQYLGHGVKGEEREDERERSPVELDISFESNSLVAKAIVAPPSSSASVPDLNETQPYLDFGHGQRSKWVSDGDNCSGLPPVRMSSVIVDLNRSPCKGNDSSCSGKEVSVHKNVGDGSSRGKAGEADDSHGKNKVSPADDSRGKNKVPNSVKVGNASSGKPSLRVVKKKKIVKRVVKKGTANPKSVVLKSVPANKLPGTVEVKNVAHSSSSASCPEKIEVNLDEESNTVDKVAEPVCLRSLPKEGSVLKEDKEGGSSLLSLGPASRPQECKSEKDSDIGNLSRFETDGNISNSPSCASSSEYKKSDSDCLDANNSVHYNGNTVSVNDNANTYDCLDADNSVPNTDNGTKSLNGTTISEVSHMDYDSEQLGQSEVSLSHGNYSNEGSPQNSNLVDVGDELFKSSDTLSSSGRTRIQDGLYCLQHATALKHSSDNGSSNLEDSISIHCSGIMHNSGKQVSPADVIISPENCETEKTFPNCNISAGSVEGDTNDIKKRKVRTQLNFLSSEMECLSPEHVNPVGLANNVDGGSNLLLKDPCPSEVLDQSVPSLDFNSQSSLDGVTALHGKGGVLQAQVYVGNNDNDDANEVSPASKRGKVTASLPNFTQCQSEFSAVIVAGTSSAEAPVSFSDNHNQEHKDKVALSSMGMGIPSTTQSMPYSEDITKLSDNNLARGSFETIDANKEKIISSKYLELQHSDIVSSSPCEDLAFPNVQFSSSEGECKVNITPIVPITNTQADVLAIGNIMGEKTDLQAIEENYQYSDFVQRSPRADMKPNDPNMKNDLLAQQNLVSCPPGGDEVTTSNSNDELIEDAPGAVSDMFSQGIAPDVLDRRILESTAIRGENICRDDENPDNISMVEHGSDINTFTPSIQQTKKIMKSDHAIGRSNLITKKTMSEPSQVSSQVTTQALNSYHFELSGTKNQSGGVIPKTFSGHSLTFSKSKTKTSVSSTHVSKPRTWHRTGNNPPTSLPRIKPSVGTVPPKRPIVERKGNFQNTSYVRKGNSLVRKPTSVSALPQISPVNQLSSLGLDEIPKSIKSECRGDEISKIMKSESRSDATDQPIYLRTGATNVPQQRQRTPPLPIDTKSEENASSSLVQPPSGGRCESASDPRKSVKSNDNAPSTSEDALKHCETPENQTGPSDSGESHVEANNGSIFSLNTKRIVYIKPKTNQLVATSNSCDVSVSTDDNGQTAFSDNYYKRRKNQLVRTTFESHINQTVAMPNSTANSDGQGTSNALCNRRISKKRSHKVARSSCRRSRASLVWTLCKNSSEYDRNSWRYQKVLPQLFPWKRTTFLRSLIHNSVSSFNSSSMFAISKKLLQLRKRDTVYTRSTHGFSLWKSRVLGVGGCSLKWSKSIEKNSKQANEEATLAVAAVERKKREQKKAVCIGSQSKRERIFRIGSVRYRMDPSRRTLQRISDENDESLPSASTCSGLASKRAYIPRRLVIGNDEYVRIGNGNQLIRDPKKRTRKLANEKVRWSLHTARQRLARKQKYCQFFTRFGKCKKDAGKCPYIHDPSKIAVCTKFLNGLCATPNCKLTHKVIPERMPDCSYFLQGLCSNRNCPYRHVNVNPKASICEGFLKGYCADGNECRKKHSYVCPTFEATGSCSQGTKCKLHHPKKQSKAKKRKRSEDQNSSRGRYFGSILANVSESGMMAASKRHKQCELEEELSDYISLDVNEEVADTNQSFEPAALCDNDSLDLQLNDFDELIKPVLLLKTRFSLPSPRSSSLQA